MPKETENRKFVGGIDANTAPFAMEPNSLLNAVNIRSLLSDGQHTGELQQVLGNSEITAVTALLPSGDNIQIGKWASPETNCLYACYYNSTTPFSLVLEYNHTTGTARILIDDTRVTGGLGFSATMFVSMRVVSGLLIWTDNTHDIRYLNLATDYMSGPALAQMNITLISEPPVVPLTSVRVDSPLSSTTIQFTPLQFTWRFILKEGFTSVLAPYSLTSFATRESDVLLSSTAGNTITITASIDQKIPRNWKYVEFVVRYPDSNSFYVIHRWSVFNTDDVTAINNHNSGFAGLELPTWNGDLNEILPEDYTAKENDNLANKAGYIELAANRLFTGDITEGYDTPSVDVSITTTNTTYTPAAPTYTTFQTYLVFVKQFDVNKMYFAVVIREGSVNYLLPKECSIGSFESGNLPNPTTMDYNQVLPLAAPVFALPTNIHRFNLIRLKETGDFRNLPYVGPAATSSNPAASRTRREAIVVEANALVGFESEYSHSSTFDHWMVPYTTIRVDDDAPDKGISGQVRALVPEASYKVGLQLYDEALRKSGSLQIGTISIPQETAFTGPYVEKVAITPVLAGGQSLPSWAKYYSLLFSRNQRTQRLIQYLPGLVKTAILENELVVFRGRDAYSSTPTSSLRGIAFSLDALASAGYGYEYTPGDLLEYQYINGSSVFISGKLVIREVYAGHIITYDDIAQHAAILDMIDDYLLNFNLAWTAATYDTTMRIDNAPAHLQKKVKVTILSKNQNDLNLYEIAAFGSVVQSGGDNIFGMFFTSGSTTVNIYGDAFLQKRVSEIGSGTVISSTSNERNTLLWITDLGRISPIDYIGQQHLPSAIRWSNVHIPGASTNGYASFDALDVKTVDETAGAITGLILTTKGTQDGGQLLVICEYGSFTALVGQQILSDSSGSTDITLAAADRVLGDFNAIKGGWGSRSPRSITRHQHRVWWVDGFNKEVIEFNDSGANSISSFKASRLFQQLLARVAGTADEVFITACASPFHRELMVSIPASSPSNAADLNTVPGLPNPFNSYVNQPATYCYNYEDNKWQMRYDSGNEFMILGDAVFGWSPATKKLYREFIGTPGSYNGSLKSAMISLPFNSNYPMVKSPRGLRLMANRATDACWLMADDGGSYQHVAGIGQWQKREGQFYADVRRDRTSNGATTAPAWKESGLNGKSIKGGVIFVVLIWNAGGATINASSLGLDWAVSSGHGDK